MRAPSRAGIASLSVLLTGLLAGQGPAHAQFRIGGGQRGQSNAQEAAPGFGGQRGNGGTVFPGNFPQQGGVGGILFPGGFPQQGGGGMERQPQGRRPQRGEGDASNGRRGPTNGNPTGPNPGQPFQGSDGRWYYPDGRPYGSVHPGPGGNLGQPYQATDGNWYYPDGRPYTGVAQPAMGGNQGQPFLATDGNWYYPDGRPYTGVAAQPAAANPGQPYLAVDGNWYYPDGRPYVAPAAAAAPASTAATPSRPAATEPATPAANIIPDLARPAAIAGNSVRTRLPAARPPVRESLGQELTRSLEEGIERMEDNLRAALFGEADEAAFLAIYKRSFTEDTPQFRLARKNIKSLDADELRQGLAIDQVVDAGAQVYPSKLEVSARFGAFKREVLEGRSAAELDQASKALLKTYERIARAPEFADTGVPAPEQVRAEVARLRGLFEVRQRLAAPAPAEGTVAMDRRLWVVSYPGLPRDAIQAVDPQVCLWGTGTGAIDVREAGLVDLGVPLLNRVASPLPEAPKPPARSGALVYSAKDAPAPVNYVIDGASFELKPGESRSHEVAANSRITYDRGGGLGNMTYQLAAGSYRFAVEDRAWQLTKPTFSAVIDNSANGCDFRCEVDGQARTVPARKTLEVAGNYPISIRFEREEGQPASTKVLDEPRPVTVGVAPGSTALDLYPGTSQELCVRPVAPEAVASLPQAEPTSPARAGRQPLLPTVDDLQ
ncbi:hypothetical protein OJF2_74050 [Aquisphaera giovannonii]|uniref:PA14 domain protein n=1 Tax=Aquisphaera giovannonii TaxID=406548 RepID=A0A5B9WFF1_9BACT|nr:hypothetical protein [Aquisphaera giovannonii]QEH38795.1 hypothetical protein OJF2_74050 [Aquisphaera giovannonii]